MTSIGERVVVFDVETKELIPDKRGSIDYKELGWACVCALDLYTGDSHVFLEDNAQEIVSLLQQAHLVAGFNIEGFDLPFLESFFPGVTQRLPTYDLLYYCRRAIGWQPHHRFPKGLKLDEVLQGTFGGRLNKTGSGALAPDLYKKGEMGKLISYCLADVRREAELFLRAWDGCLLKAPMHGEFRLQDPRDRMVKKEEK